MKERIQQLIRFHRIKAWYEKYERALIPATLVLGIIFDSLRFAVISVSETFILVLVYAVVAAGFIAYALMYDSRTTIQQEADAASKTFHKKFFSYLRLASPLIIQFTSGGLLSNALIFYWFSGSVYVSWPFIVLLVLLMAGNDVFREFYLRPVVQISVYFFGLFTLSTTMLPYLFNSLSPWIFVLSSAASLSVITLYLYFLFRVVPALRAQKQHFIITFSVIVALMNALYFTNIIPPVPLALRETGVYHLIERNASGYRLTAEKEPWWGWFLPGRTIHVQPGQPVYVYTAIFAPEKLTARIVHVWQYYDEVKKIWITSDQPSFALTGGRQEGFRGYSRKTTVTPGKWRVNVTTERGQVLGRVSFSVVAGENPFGDEVIMK